MSFAQAPQPLCTLPVCRVLGRPVAVAAQTHHHPPRARPKKTLHKRAPSLFCALSFFAAAKEEKQSLKEYVHGVWGGGLIIDEWSCPVGTKGGVEKRAFRIYKQSFINRFDPTKTLLIVPGKKCSKNDRRPRAPKPSYRSIETGCRFESSFPACSSPFS